MVALKPFRINFFFVIYIFNWSKVEMKNYLFLSVIAIIILPSLGYSQHSDIEFGYDDVGNPTTFDIEGFEFTSDGFTVFEGEMEELDPFNLGNFSSNEPGFTTNFGEGLSVNVDDLIWLQALDASQSSAFGVGFVNYYNPTSQLLETAGRLSIIDNSTSTVDLVLNGDSIESGPNPQFLGRAGDSTEHSLGVLHDHVVIDLLDDATAPLGAYGILFQLQTDLADANGDTDGNIDFSSDPFWIVWNHGLSDDVFENEALASFGVVPEPSGLGLLVLSSALFLVRRRNS